MAISNRKLVDNVAGVMNRSIFADNDIYKQELEQVFGRCWLFVGHESQIPKPNDFVANYMGEDPVLVTRDSKGKLHSFLNMCRHRGNRICRADAGNTPSFMCTYHGWTFATDGKLVGVPGYKEAYFEELDRSQWGLVEAPKVESYKGMVFANWDKAAPSLLDYLGDMTFILDMVLDRREGGTELVGGISKWVMGANWKLAADNFGGDGYHFYLTHGSTIAIRSAGGRTQRFGEGGESVSTGNGHGAVRFYANSMLKRANANAVGNDIVTRYHLEHLDETRKRLGDIRADNLGSAGDNNIFPNVSGNGTHSIKLWHPRGPTHTEAWTYCLVDKAAPQEVKNEIKKRLTGSFGPSGMAEQDDMNNFIQCTSSAGTWRGKQVPLNQQLGLGHERNSDELPGRVQPCPSEMNQRSFYGRWQEIMDAPSWNDIKIDPRTVK